MRFSTNTMFAWRARTSRGVGMATRPVFHTSDVPPYYESVMTDFEFCPGFSLKQKRGSIHNLHAAYQEAHPKRRLLEVSSRSEDELGFSLSAFNLRIYPRGNKPPIPVECAFQGSKVFEAGGPYPDLFSAAPRDAKRDERIRGGGPMVRFEFAGRRFPLEPKDAFYNWLYIHALSLPQNAEIAKQALAYDSFTDIEFNPKRSINCQGMAVAAYVGLSKTGKLGQALTSFGVFLEVVYGMTDGTGTGAQLASPADAREDSQVQLSLEELLGQG